MLSGPKFGCRLLAESFRWSTRPDRPLTLHSGHTWARPPVGGTGGRRACGAPHPASISTMSSMARARLQVEMISPEQAFSGWLFEGSDRVFLLYRVEPGKHRLPCRERWAFPAGWVARHADSEPPRVCERNALLSSDDEVVEHAHVYQGEGVPDPSGDCLVRAAGLPHA